MLRDVSVATMNASQTKTVDKHLSNAGKLFQKIAGSTLRELEKHPELPQLIEQFNNTFVRKGEKIKDSRRHAIALQRWIEQRFKKEEAKRTTEKGKKAQREKLNAIMSFFSKKNTASLVAMYDLQKELVEAKLILINKLDTLSNISTFVQTRRGYQTTGAEGYVAIDKMSGGAVKLVDRMEFSYNNFSPEILKGWNKPSRN